MMQEIEEPLLENTEDRDNSENSDNAQDNANLEVSINHDPPPSPDPAMIPERLRPMTKRRVIRNMCVLLFSMFLFFMGFMALSNLQSTMNAEKGLGTDSQATIYICSMLSAVLLPQLVIQNIGCKWGLIVAVSCSVSYIAMNWYPRFWTLIPAAILLGLSAGPLTSSQSYYVNEMALRYHRYSEDSVDSLVSSFFGLNSVAQELTQVFGNAISYGVLSPRLAPVVNETNFTNCGVHFIRFDSNVTLNSNFNLQAPTDGQRELLVAIFVLGNLVSVALLYFYLDELGTDVQKDDTEKSKCSIVVSQLTGAIKHAMKADQMFLIPISIYCGIETSFYASDFTQAYIACSWGVHHVGFVTICFGVCGAGMSIAVGPLVKYTSQMCVILLAAVINVVTCIFLYIWDPSPEIPYIYFVFAGVWGMTDAIWWSQIAALYGLTFPDDREAAFSNFFFWSFLGYFLSYSYANYFDVAVKINIMLVFLLVGMALYIIGQIKLKCCTHRSAYVQIGDSE